MDKKETVIVFCGSSPTPSLVKMLDRARAEGFIVHTVSPSKDDLEAIRGVEADLVIYSEVGTSSGMSEALSELTRNGLTRKVFSDLESKTKFFPSRSRQDPSKFDWKKFTKNVESTSRRR
jgi:hypothetical protein